MRDERGKPCSICGVEPAVYQTVRRCAQCHSIARAESERTPLDQPCAVCKRVGTRRPARDHDHETGHFRDLLCQQCNVMLGMGGEDPAILEAGAAYLRLHVDFAAGQGVEPCGDVPTPSD